MDYPTVKLYKSMHNQLEYQLVFEVLGTRISYTLCRHQVEDVAIYMQESHDYLVQAIVDLDQEIPPPVVNGVKIITAEDAIRKDN